MIPKFKRLLIAVAATLSAVTAGSVMAQTYPDKPVALVIPFAAGGPTDVVARMLAVPMGKALGQTV